MKGATKVRINVERDKGARGINLLMTFRRINEDFEDQHFSFAETRQPGKLVILFI